MDKATIEITKEEARLLPLLLKIPMSTSLENAGQLMKYRLLADGLIEKARKAFAPEGEVGQAPKRKRH